MRLYDGVVTEQATADGTVIDAVSLVVVPLRSASTVMLVEVPNAISLSVEIWRDARHTAVMPGSSAPPDSPEHSPATALVYVRRTLVSRTVPVFCTVTW